MDYTSSVAYSIRFKNNQQRDKFLLLIEARGDKWELAALKECVSDKPNCRITFQGVGKWYEQYPDVQAHMRLMTLAEESFPEDVEWRFARAGEDNSDTEERSSERCDYDMYEEATVCVSIQHDIPDQDEGIPDD